MKILVLGAGVSGITTAWALAEHGHDVQVLEESGEAASQCSFANGGQLSYTHAEPWANPGTLPKVLKWMFKEDAPLVMRFSPDLDMLRWAFAFLRNCTQARSDRNSETLLRLGLYSRLKMAELLESTEIEFHHLQKGILHIFSKEHDYRAAMRQSLYQEKLGCHEDVLTLSQCLQHEPALQHATKRIVGGIYSQVDESGDVHVFTQNLAKWCEERRDVKIHYNTRLAWLRRKNGQIVAAETSRGSIEADAFVMCLGSHSPIFLKPLGIRAPIYPMKGYSITIPSWESAPEISITDNDKKIVISRLGDYVRAAGTAEFAGYNTHIREARIAPLRRCLQQLFPDAPIFKHRHPTDIQNWACLRPQTPDGPPIIGNTPISNLYINSGHGTLGWTQAAGSAALLANIVDGRNTEISMNGLELKNYVR